MREVVAGVDHQVRLQRAQSGQPALPGRRMRRHMEIGNVQYANGPRTWRQDRDIDPTEPERIDLVQPRVRQAAGADRPNAEQAPDDGRGRAVPRHNQKATSEPAATLVACLMHQALSRSASAQI